MSNTNIKKVRTSDLELKDRLVSIQRVTKVTKGGRTFSFSAIVVVGNEDGVVGYGLGKASEVQSAIAKGVEDAKKNLVKIPVINGTIPHKQELRFGGSLGSDTHRVLGGVHAGYEHNYRLRGGWQVYWQVKSDLMIKGKDLFRTGIVLGVKLPVK